MKLLKDVFEVTETLQNGRERRKKVPVYSKPFITLTNQYGISETRYNNYPERMVSARLELKAKHYYDIEYVETVEIERLTTF